MAGQGPLPSGNAVRRNKEERTAVVQDDVLRGPELPKSYKVQLEDGSKSVRFTKDTREWYDAWRGSPQAQQFVATDWLRLQMLARMVDGFYRHPSGEFLDKIRLNESLLGGTVGDRARLKLDVKHDGDASGRSGHVSELDEKRRERLRGLASG